MKLVFIDRVGSLGTLIAAMACPVCWPVLATLGSSLGLGIFAPWEGIISNFVFPPFVVIAVLGTFLSFRSHKKRLPFVLGIVSGSLILFGFYVIWQPTLVYIGIFGLLISSVLGYLGNKQQEKLCLN